MSSSRGRTASSVGMMEGAFFVGKSDLLSWANKLLAVNLTKVEQCASGAVYCQIIDACHPGSVKISKLNWMARTDYEFLPNYKILQAAFDRNGIEKHIDVDKLIRAKYQDNLEFFQWMKCYWEHEGSGRSDYEPMRAREGKPVPPWAKVLGAPVAGPGPARSQPTTEKENCPSNRDPSGAKKFDPSVRKAGVARSAAAVAGAGGAAVVKSPTAGARPAARVGGSLTKAAESEDLKLKVADQADELEELRSTLDGLESERDYYFTKLRNIEILCSTLQSNADGAVDAAGVIRDVQAILYAEVENDEAGDADNLEGAVADTLPAADLEPLPFEGELLGGANVEEGVAVA